MTQTWVRPEDYAYGPNTTLRELWDHFLLANKGMITAGALAKHFGVEPETMRQFMEGTAPSAVHSLLTRYCKTLLTTTGIDMDRYVVCAAKQRIIANHPDLAERIDFKTSGTRQEIVDALRPYVARYGAPNVDAQIGVSGGTTHHWLTGFRNPSGDTLESLLVSLAKGLSEGTSDDVVMWKVTNAAFEMTLEELLPGISTFREAVAELLRPFAKRDARTIAEHTGIKANTIIRMQDFLKSDEKTYNVPTETAILVLEAILRSKRPELVDRLSSARDQLLGDGKPGKKTEVVRPKVAPEQATEPATAPPPAVVAEPPPVAAPAEAEPETRAVPSWNAQMAVHFRALAELCEKKEEEKAKEDAPPIPTISETTTLDREIGELLNGVKHCLTGRNFHPRPGEPISEETVLAIESASDLLRRVLHLVAQADPGIRLAVFHRIAPGIDEIFVSKFALQFPSVLGATKMVQATRKQIHADRRK